MRKLLVPVLFSTLLTAACDESGSHYFESFYYKHISGVDDNAPEVELWELRTYSIAASCEESDEFGWKDHTFEVKPANGPYFYVIVYYGGGSEEELLGAHQLYTEYAADPDYPERRQGFYARYKRCAAEQDCTDTQLGDDDPVAESGTVTMSRGDDGLEMSYDIVFAADIHETGHWVLKQCGTPYCKDF